MTRNMKESYSNIFRTERSIINKEKASQRGSTQVLNNKSTISSNITSDCTVNTSEPFNFHEEYWKNNPRGENERSKRVNLKNLEVTSFESGVNSFGEEIKSKINFNSLPLYCICEKSTQTLLTGRDIEDLQHLQRQLTLKQENSPGDNLLQDHSKKKLIASTSDKKYCNAKNGKAIESDSISRIDSEKNDINFIQIKRRTSNDFHSFKTVREKVPRNANTSLQHNNNLKNTENTEKKKRKPRGFRKKSHQVDEDFLIHLTEDDQILDPDINNSKINKTQSEQLHLETKTKKEINEDFDIPDIINDIKNSSRKGQIKKEDPNSSFTSITNQDCRTNQNNTNNKNIKSEEEPLPGPTKKIKDVKKFDAYLYFKVEFAASNKDKSEEELEKLCRKEWNLLDKDTKKIYNLNAERERKIHKLKMKTKTKVQNNFEEN